MTTNIDPGIHTQGSGKKCCYVISICISFFFLFQSFNETQRMNIFSYEIYYSKNDYVTRMLFSSAIHTQGRKNDFKNKIRTNKRKIQHRKSERELVLGTFVHSLIRSLSEIRQRISKKKFLCRRCSTTKFHITRNPISLCHLQISSAVVL